MSSNDAEVATFTTQAKAIGALPVVYPDDHVPNPDEIDLPRKMAPFPIDLPPPPTVSKSGGASGSAGSVSLIIKSLKPPISFPLSDVSPTDSILSVKERLASEHSRAPPADIQRLLLKGKVLADGKLLKEYLSSDPAESSIALSLMIKPGASWAAEEKMSTDQSGAGVPNLHIATGGASLAAPAATGVARKAHARTASEGGAADQFPVPSLVLSTPGSPTSETPGRRSPVPLEIADPSVDGNSLARPGSPSSASGMGGVLIRPQFWTRLREFLEGEAALSEGVRASEVADELFETFLLASKGHLEPTDIARIRDSVNITGMAGT